MMPTIKPTGTAVVDCNVSESSPFADEPGTVPLMLDDGEDGSLLRKKVEWNLLDADGSLTPDEGGDDDMLDFEAGVRGDPAPLEAGGFAVLLVIGCGGGLMGGGFGGE